MRTVELSLERLLDVVTAIQFDGIDQVHHFLGEVVGQLHDTELREYVKSLEADGYDHNDRNEADRHLRRWRERYCDQPKTTPKSTPKPKGPPPTTDDPDYGEGYET